MDFEGFLVFILREPQGERAFFNPPLLQRGVRGDFIKGLVKSPSIPRRSLTVSKGGGLLFGGVVICGTVPPDLNKGTKAVGMCKAPKGL